MKLVFPGTRGEIDVRTRLHRMHSCLMVAGRILVDCGADWLSKTERLRPRAIVLTHAHPDHAGALKYGAPCEVYATEETWDRLKAYPIRDRRVIHPRQPRTIYGITFEAFVVEHSLLAPAVGYRITAVGVSVFYAPDLVSILDQPEALSGAAAYIGDGASLTRPLVRKRGDARIGHASVREQLDWCRDENVRQAVITHCWSGIVKAKASRASEQIKAMGDERGVKASLAYDGMELSLRAPRGND